QPLVYELDADMNPIRSYYLGDAAAIEAAIKTITQQGRTS
ncbi:MAG: 2,3-diphosphoglycerate-dependent phosphoglycerate mutase, partial [Burkholderiaceae bacterium]